MPLKPFKSRGDALAPYHLRDDFDDGAYQDREGDETALHLDAQNSAVAGRVLSARFRPEWVVADGRITVTDAALVSRTETAMVATPSRLTTGTWDVGIRWPRDAPTDATVTVDLLARDPHSDGDGPRTSLRIGGDGSAVLGQAAGGATVDGGWSRSRSSLHDFTVERTPAGALTLAVNGVSAGAIAPVESAPVRPGVVAVHFDGASSGPRPALDAMEVR